MKTRFIILVLILFPRYLFSQVNNTRESEIGIDLFWLTKVRTTDPSIFFKQIRMRDAKGKFSMTGGGYRFRVGGHYRQPEEERTTPGAPPMLLKDDYSLLVRIGYEWRKRISSVDFFYGVDAWGEFSGRTTENLGVHLDTGSGGYSFTLFDVQDLRGKVGVSPVLGFSAKLFQALQLSFESVVNLGYGQTYTSYTGNASFPDFTVEGDGLELEILPLYMLNISYKF